MKIFILILVIFSNFLNSMLSSSIFPNTTNNTKLLVQAYNRIENNQNLEDLPKNNNDYYPILKELNYISLTHGAEVDKFRTFEKIKIEKIGPHPIKSIEVQCKDYSNGKEGTLLSGKYPTKFNEILVSEDLLEYVDEDNKVKVITYETPNYIYDVVGVCKFKRTIVLSEEFYAFFPIRETPNYPNDYTFKSYKYTIENPKSKYRFDFDPKNVNVGGSLNSQIYIDIEDLKSEQACNLIPYYTNEYNDIYQTKARILLNNIEYIIDDDFNTSRKDPYLYISFSDYLEIQRLHDIELNWLLSYENEKDMMKDKKIIESKVTKFGKQIYDVQIVSGMKFSNCTNTYAIITGSLFNILINIIVGLYLIKKPFKDKYINNITISLVGIILAIICLPILLTLCVFNTLELVFLYLSYIVPTFICSVTIYLSYKNIKE